MLVLDVTGSDTNHNIIVEHPEQRFRDVGNYDVRHRQGSPSIDAAHPASATKTDIDGMERPQGARTDIGPYELTNLPAPASRYKARLSLQCKMTPCPGLDSSVILRLLCLQTSSSSALTPCRATSVRRRPKRSLGPPFGPVVKVTIYEGLGLALGSATHIDYILRIHGRYLSPLISHKYRNTISFIMYRRPSKVFIDLFFGNFQILAHGQSEPFKASWFLPRCPRPVFLENQYQI